MGSEMCIRDRADTESHSVRMIDLKTGKLELIAGDGKKGDGSGGEEPEKVPNGPFARGICGQGRCYLYRRYQYPQDSGDPSLRNFLFLRTVEQDLGGRQILAVDKSLLRIFKRVTLGKH